MHSVKSEQLGRVAEYLAEWLVSSLAPTIVGSKPSTILTLADCRYQPLLSMWRNTGDAVLEGTVIQFKILHSSEGKETVLFFRSDTLEQCIETNEHKLFLEKLGYPVAAGVEQCLELLKQRFQFCCPHEIGVLLGIPLKDVLGFMGITDSNITCRGEWCIYGHPDDSLALMKRYAQDRESVSSLMEQGLSPCQILRGKRANLPQAV